MYYLQSRYYNPELGRFINADALAGKVGELLSHNVFAYCQNNSVNALDSNGFSMRGIDGAGGGCDGGAGSPAIGYAIIEIAKEIEEEGRAIRESGSELIEKAEVKVSEEAKHTIYTLREQGTGVIKYVGRTINEYARKAAHKLADDKKDLIFTPEKRGLVYNQARGAEQYLFEKFGGIDNLLNKIRPVSEKNPKINEYMREALKLFE